jgi:hypothetical protein
LVLVPSWHLFSFSCLEDRALQVQGSSESPFSWNPYIYVISQNKKVSNKMVYLII